YTGGDTSWKDGTEMSWHYWTQPLSNPLSPIFYRVPASVHAMETYSTYISEGEILGGQAEYIRVSFADINCLLIENDVSDGKAVYLLDFIPTAYHGCQIGNVKQGQEIGSLNVNNNDEFILVKRNKKKIKTNHQHYQHHQQYQHYPQHHVLYQHHHQPDAPTNKNIITTNTSLQRNSLLPSTSQTYSHNHEMDMKNVISEQAIRFAQTRFPFPPIIIKFAQDVNENFIIKSIEKHFNDHFYMDLSIAGHRLKGKRDLILFAGNRESFVLLYDDKKWPQHLNSIVFEKAGAKHL
ncbi:unnamed protein product, partial [Rotaria sp. Silwood1]